jgi:hypothetical protein
MKLLAGVMGAEPHALNGMHQMSRETWVRDFSEIGDCRFFVGHGGIPLQPDEIRVDVPDDKEHILYKTVAIMKYMLENDYDMVLKLDTDTFVNVNSMRQQNYEGLDYVGAPVGTLGEYYAHTEAYSFIQGSATWLSRKAAKIIIDKAVPNMLNSLERLMKYNGLICPYPHSEDLWIGQVLTPYIKSGDIKALSDYGYSKGPLTYHFALTRKDTGFKCWMYGLHAAVPNTDKMDQIHKDRSE